MKVGKKIGIIGLGYVGLPLAMTYVKKGSMRVLLYDDQKNHLEDYILNEGDTAVFAYGGHGYEILEDNTQILEAKNGPFVDVDTDKTKFQYDD